MATALIAVDVQNDFCEGGSLPVEGGAAVAARIAELLSSSHGYDAVVATKDEHQDPGRHFAGDEGPDYVLTWPVHCCIDTRGAALHEPLEESRFDAVFSKGRFAAAYSGFEGATPAGERLADWLHARGVTHVDVCGIATDHCVRATALDAVAAGFTVSVLSDLVAGVAPATTADAIATMRGAGVAFRDSGSRSSRGSGRGGGAQAG